MVALFGSSARTPPRRPEAAPLHYRKTTVAVRVALFALLLLLIFFFAHRLLLRGIVLGKQR
jgi:hypothetical protein